MLIRTAAVLAVLVVALALLAANARADSFRISQESAAGLGDFDANVLGFVTEYSTSLSASAFYAYDGSYNGDDNGGPGAADGLSQLFLVSASDGLSLFIVHDEPFDGSGGAAKTKFVLSGDTAAITAEDDPRGQPNPDSYTEDGTTFTADHSWGVNFTDGYAIGSLDGSWTMLGEFTAAVSGLSTWQVTSADGNDLTLALGVGRRVRIDTASQPIPEPGTLALLGAALCGVALAVRRRRAD